MSDDDIIAAIATATGRGGIGVVRVSGARLDDLIAGIAGKPLRPRHAELLGFLDRHGEILDQGLALYFPAPYSYTGQAVLELQGHGGPVVLQLLLRRCLELGARLAEPGEFTRRAYLNGKLDLAQAESVIDLIDAATEQAARGAMRSLRGAFSRQIEAFVDSLIALRAEVEGVIDFPEEDVEFLEQSRVRDRVALLQSRLLEILAQSQQGSLLREGIHVVLAGQPNVGKSSLLNQLAGEDLAIVTEMPGTTRDAIRQTVELEGVAAHVIDTAGLRESSDPVEKLGITRTWEAIAKADLVLMLTDATQNESPADHKILMQIPGHLPRIRVMNKIDLSGHQAGHRRTSEGATVWISAKTGVGIDLLRRAILDAVGWRGGEESLFIARTRHVQSLQAALAALERAAMQKGRVELLAEELRLAQQSLASITGEYTADDLLGEIFSRFCIGK